MRLELKEAFKSEMSQAIQAYRRKTLDLSFFHLERAHILGQSFIIPHTRTHWWMLKIALKRCDGRETFGQVMRIIGSILFSRIWVPIGNTGGANVNPMKPMPVPEDLRKILDRKNA